jgi:hypothetical protein
MGKFFGVTTDDQLRAAFERRRRANWPDSFDEAMADEWYRRLITIEAFCHMRRMQAQAAYNGPP